METIINPFRFKWWALIGLSLLAFTAFLDFTIVNTALPAIQKSLDAPVVKLQWIVSIFALMLTVLMIAMGKLGDILGRRKIFYIGCLLFIFAAVGAGLAPSINWLIFFRAWQGVGAAIVFTLAAALVPTAFPEAEQNSAIGIYNAITGVGLAIGPFLGGVLVNLFNWRAVFFVNVPIIVLGFLCCSFSVKESKSISNAKIDWRGLGLLIVGVGSLVFSISRINGGGFDFASGLMILGGAAILFLLFVVEKRIPHPLLDLDVFHNPQLLLGVLISVGGGIISLILLFFAPLYLSVIKGLAAFPVGLCLIAMPFAQVLVSLFWGKIDKTLGINRVVIAAFAAGGFAAILQLWFTSATSYVLIIITFLLAGIIWGCANCVAISIAVRNVASEKVGSVIGTFFTFWNLIGSVALTIASIIFSRSEVFFMNQLLASHDITLTAAQNDLIVASLADPERSQQLLAQLVAGKAEKILPLFKYAFLQGFHDAIWLALLLLFTGLMWGWWLVRSLKYRTGETA